MEVTQSAKLANVCYDIRGPVLQEAKRMEAEGHHVLKLNIGNPAPFGFEAPEEILQDVILNLPSAHGYGDSKGLLSARRAVVQYYQGRGVTEVDIEDVYLGNGVSELIVMALQGLLDNGDEVLVPMPDYPLWTAAVSLCGGRAVHYRCDESADWQPDLEDLASKITPRSKALVVINPNNPTGAVYARQTLEQLVELARRHNLVLFSDEIYDKILYDDAEHVATASLAPDLLCLTFNGLSKAYRVAGFRTGWMVVSGPKGHAASYIEGLDILANMRLCPNVPTQYAVQTALGGHQSINDLVLPGGRLHDQRDTARRRAVRAGPAAGGEAARGAGDRVQLADARPRTDRDAAAGGGPGGRARALRALPRRVPRRRTGVAVRSRRAGRRGRPAGAGTARTAGRSRHPTAA
jgi:alanine-synthesizing transaminase